MKTKEVRTCDVCDSRPAKHYLDLQGIRLAVCSACAVEARRDGIDLDEGLWIAVRMDETRHEREPA